MEREKYDRIWNKLNKYNLMSDDIDDILDFIIELEEDGDKE
jgi:hypothetical protein